MKRTFTLLALAAVSLAAAGCSKKDAPAGDNATGASTAAAAAAAAAAAGGSCNHTEQGMCVEYPSSLSASDAVDEKKDCEKDKGTWGASACPAANVLGTCTNPKQGGDMKIKLYKGTAFKSADEAKKAMCSDTGDSFVAAK